MPRIIQPLVSPRGRIIVLTGATLWLIAAMVLSATPERAGAAPVGSGFAVTALNSIDKIDGEDAMLYYPRVFADGAAGVYVTDKATPRVVRLSGDLRTVEATYGLGKGAGPGEMQRPRAVAVDSRGNVFVSDVALKRISKFAADGTFLKSIATTAVASLVIDAEDRLIGYPSGGTELLQRFTNDLEEDERFLKKVDRLQHSSPLGVLLAMDGGGRLYLLDQFSLRLGVYDRDMQQVAVWGVDAPLLRETVAMRLGAALEIDSGAATEIRLSGIQSMAIDPSGRYLTMAYMMVPSEEVRYSRVVWYSVDGELLDVEDRNDVVYASTLLGGGRIVEGSAESLRVLEWGPQRNTASSES